LETLLAFVALCLVVCECCGKLSSRTPGTPRCAAWWWVAGLIASYAAILALVFYAVRHQYPAELWRSTMMPLAVVENRAPARHVLYENLVAGAMLYLSAFQSYALLALYRQVPSRTTVRIGCGVMLVLSCAAPALTSFDLYGYVHDAQLGFAAYRPPNVPFSGEYRVFDLWFGKPSATPYGPLWLVVAGLVTSVAPTLFGKLMALRVFGVLVYLGVLAGLRALGLPSRIQNVFALNPGLMFQYVANGHNDMLAIAVLVCAAAVVRTRASLAFGLIAVAALLKLPYALLGLPIVAAVRPVRVRVAGGIAMFAAVAAISWICGGSGYLDTLTEHGAENAFLVMRKVSDVVAVALILLAAAGGRRLRSGVWSIPTLGAIIFPWYFVWGFPYALGRRRILGYLLVCFPFASMLAGNPFVLPWDIVVVAAWVVALSLRDPRAGLRGKPSLLDAAPPNRV
jgi:hypothetical protein